MYAVSINTGKIIYKKKTKMDKNVHKVAQGLVNKFKFITHSLMLNGGRQTKKGEVFVFGYYSQNDETLFKSTVTEV